MQLSDMQPHQRPAELDRDAGIRRQISLADNSADGAFTADQNGFDVAAVFVGNEVRRKTLPAWKVDDLDVVARIIKQGAGAGLFVHEVRLNQRKVAGAEPPQQIVVWPPVSYGLLASRCHFRKCPCPASVDDN